MKNEIHIIHWTKIIWVPVSRMPYWNVVKYTSKKSSNSLELVFMPFTMSGIISLTNALA